LIFFLVCKIYLERKSIADISYCNFLIENENHGIIFNSSISFISTSSFSNWKTFDDYWASKLLEEVEKTNVEIIKTITEKVCCFFYFVRKE
jgi:hypothetical protein